MTPMKRLQTNFKSLRNNLSHSFDTLTLNKAEPRYSPFGGEFGWGGTSKGVKNDFLLIFSMKKNYGTIAFIVNYIDQENPTFLVQMKLTESNESITSSLTMDYDTFRLKLNCFNQKVEKMHLKQNSPIDSPVHYFHMINHVFECSDINFEVDAKSGERECREALKQIDNHIEATENDHLALQEGMDAALKRVENSVSRTKEQKLINEMEKEIIELKRTVELRRKSYEKDNNILSRGQKLYEAMTEAKKAKYERKKKISELHTQYPKVIFDHISKSICL